jgi:molecular chaperone DnaK (HSP70)
VFDTKGNGPTLGIDLGTTNSLIGYGDSVFSGLVASNVDTDGWNSVSRDVVSSTIVSSYKTDMGLSDDSKLAVRCSSVVLKNLRDKAAKKMGCDVKNFIISVPAYFTTSQREAVVKAASMVGMNVVRLINEPTAAALYVCRNIKDLVVVYDLGGGTFDVSIVDSRVGNYTTIATKGIVLGGDDLDRAITNEMIAKFKVPMRLRTNLFTKKLDLASRKLKEQLQKVTEGSSTVSIQIGDKTEEFTLSLEEYKSILFDVFSRTISMTQNLIAENIPASDKPKVVFVGGSTIDPHLKGILREEFMWEELDTDIAADWIVAQGVALYAKMWDDGTAWDQVDDVTKRISIEDVSGRSITVIDDNSIVPCENAITIFNSQKGSVLSLRFYQGAELFAKNNEYIGTMEYNYQDVQEAGQGAVSVTVSVSADGIVSVSAYEVLYGEGTLQNIKLSLR